MAKCYIGVSGKAKNIKNIYIGVAGKARRVVKAYVGVGGKARLFWAGGSVYKWGTATSLTTARYDFGAAHIGNYALFAAGMPADGSNLKSVETYNTSLTKGTASDFSGSNSSGRAIGGQNSTYAAFLSTDQYVYAYNSSLTLSRKNKANSAFPQYAASISSNDNILFLGGNGTQFVDIYNASLVHSKSSSYSSIKLNPAGEAIGTYAIFAGGTTSSSGGSFLSTAEIYDSSITKITATNKNLSVARMALAAASTGSYALFAGGLAEDSKVVNTVDTYNSSLTKSTTTGLSNSRYTLNGLSIDNYAIFAGGRSSFSGYLSTIDIYDNSLTRTTNSLSLAKVSLASTILGNKAIFAGGGTYQSGGIQANNTVDVFAI